MIPALVITALLIITYVLIKMYNNENRKEKRQKLRLRELHEAEQALQDLQDKHSVSNIKLTAAELSNKIKKLKNKIYKKEIKYD